MNLIQSTAAQTMSSREIAELTGKEHKNVIRDIRAMLDALRDDGSELSHVREDQDARGYTSAFHLDRELTETLLTGYSVPLRRKVIARWHELEAKAVAPSAPAQLSRLQLIEIAMQAETERLALEEKAIKLEEKITEQAPKVEALERFSGNDGRHNTRNASKLLGVPEKKVIAWLLTHGWYYRDHAGRLCAKAEKIASGYLDTTPIEIRRSDGVQTVPQAVVTQRGLAKLGELLAKDGLLPKQEAAHGGQLRKISDPSQLGATA